MSKTVITTQQVAHVAKLANLTLDEAQLQKFPTAFSETIDMVDHLKELDVSKTEPTNQVTGMENVLREDVVRPEFMFTQEQALANASETHEGFIVVPQIIEQAE